MKPAPGSRQLDLIPRSHNPLVVLDRNHRLVRLADTLDWLELEARAQEIRAKKLKSRAGRAPNLRVNLGAVIFMSIWRVTYRDAEDLIRHYGPARYLCGLTDSRESPDFTTIHDFTKLMGSDGLAALNAMAVRMAVEAGYGDPGLLVADTTAQEAPISYPTEVGLLSSFFRSSSCLAKKAGGVICAALREVRQKVEKAGTHLRTYRLFAKTKSARVEMTRKVIRLAKSVKNKLKDSLQRSGPSRVQGAAKAARRRLNHLLQTVETLLPQIEHWLDTGFVAKNKIVSLTMPQVRSIPRGKVGKDVEFGIKWGVQRIGGGFVLGHAKPSRGNFNDAKFVRESLDAHQGLFGSYPDSYAYDRAGWSEHNNDYLDEVGVRHNGIAPQGKAAWKVTGKRKEQLIKERARIEGDIGSIKCARYSFTRPAARSEEMMVMCGHRAMLGYNLNKLLRYQVAARDS